MFLTGHTIDTIVATVVNIINANAAIFASIPFGVFFC